MLALQFRIGSNSMSFNELTRGRVTSFERLSAITSMSILIIKHGNEYLLLLVTGRRSRLSSSFTRRLHDRMHLPNGE